MDPFPAWTGKISRRFRRISRGGALHRKGERNSRVVPPFPDTPRCLSPFQGNLFSQHCLEFQAQDRLTPRWHVGQPCGKASWESIVGKPRGKASWESLLGNPRGKTSDPLIHAGGSWTLLLQLGRKAHVHAPLKSRTGPLGRLHKYPKIQASTEEESSGSGTDSTQGPRPRDRRERNSETLPSNSHGDWPFLRPPELVPEVPVVSREHLPQLEKIQEVLPSRRDEAHFR